MCAWNLTLSTSLITWLYVIYPLHHCIAKSLNEFSAQTLRIHWNFIVKKQQQSELNCQICKIFRIFNNFSLEGSIPFRLWITHILLWDMKFHFIWIFGKVMKTQALKKNQLLTSQQYKLLNFLLTAIDNVENLI